jgi:hypothetical protein
MTSTEHRGDSGRFGAAAPGARLEPPSLDPVFGAAPATRRLPTWRRMLVAAAVLIAAGGGYAAGHFTAPRPPGSRFLLVTSVPLPAGARLTSADLSVVTVRTGDRPPPGALGSALAGTVTGLVTRIAVPRGTFLSRSLLARSGAVPGPGQALVGLALKPGQVPAGGLADGQQVLIVLLPANSSGVPLEPVPLIRSSVWDESSSLGTTQATVVVPADRAVRLAGYAAAGQVALVQTAAAQTAAAPGGAP